jgi:hypothetical protein
VAEGSAWLLNLADFDLLFQLLESGEAWIPAGFFSSEKLFPFRVNFIKSSNLKALFDKAS